MSYSWQTTHHNITLDDYDCLPDASYRDRIEDVVTRATSSEQIQNLLAPKGPIWPMDIFCAARTALDRDPELCTDTLYFEAVSVVLCRTLAATRTPTSPPQVSIDERHALQKRVCASVYALPRHPLRVQVLRHMHLKWTISMNCKEPGGGEQYDLDDSSSDEDDG